MLLKYLYREKEAGSDHFSLLTCHFVLSFKFGVRHPPVLCSVSSEEVGGDVFFLRILVNFDPTNELGTQVQLFDFSDKKLSL